MRLIDGHRLITMLRRYNHETVSIDGQEALIEQMESAQPERKVYGNMSDKEFEKWLYEHGICNPDINESIPCMAVPLLIDNAINELSSAQPDRKPDHWIVSASEDYAGGGYVKCGHCGYEFSWAGYFSADEWKFCPECGWPKEAPDESEE